VTISLTAQFMTFDQLTITVPAGASVTVNFTNKDTSIPHSFAVYQVLSGGQRREIFTGRTITGPDSTVYNFVAPVAAGDYFFECYVHPLQISGKFIVVP